MTRKQIIIIIILAAVGLLSVAAHRIGVLAMPGSGDLTAIRKNVIPRLTNELTEFNLKIGSPIFIRIFKKESLLELWVMNGDRYALFKSYDICSYSGDLGPKLKEGDGQSPEGFYRVSAGQLNPLSRFHLSFNLGFPNAFDRAHGRTGSLLMVHGSCVSIGCYAITNPGIEEVYLLVEKALNGGQTYVPVHIFPFRMTQDNLRDHAESEWRDFWLNLRQGYDLFEKTMIPPIEAVQNGRYIFRSG